MEEFFTAFELFQDESPDENLLKSISETGIRYYESPTYKLWKQDTPTRKYLELDREPFRATGYFETDTNTFRILLRKHRKAFTPKQKKFLEHRGFTVQGDFAHISTYPPYQFVRQ